MAPSALYARTASYKNLTAAANTAETYSAAIIAQPYRTTITVLMLTAMKYKVILKSRALQGYNFPHADVQIDQSYQSSQ